MSSNDNKEEKVTISKLGPYDVLCGRDKRCNNNAGNHQFRVLINAYLPRYMSCKSKFDRSKMIALISENILDNAYQSIRFFKRVEGSDAQHGNNDEDDTLLEQLDRKKSHEKIAHALRDYAVQHRKNEEKHERSMALQQQQQQQRQQTMPQQDILLQEQIGGNYEHGRRVTPIIDDLSENIMVAREQLMVSTYNNLASMVPEQRVSLQNPSNFSGFNGCDQYPAQLDPGHNEIANIVGFGATEGHNNNPFPLEINNPQRRLISESNHRHLERLEGTIDGSLHRSQNADEFAEFSESENYDNFEPMALTSGNSLLHMEGVERTGSNRSFGKTGSNRSFGKTGSNRSFGPQNSLRHVDVFDKGPSSRSVKKQESIDELSLLQTSMGTLSLGTSKASGMSYQGDSTLTLQTRPEMMSEKSRIEMSFERSMPLRGMSKVSAMSTLGDSTFTLQTRPEMMSEKSRMEMSFERSTPLRGASKASGMSTMEDSTFTLQTGPEMMSEKSRMEISFEVPMSFEQPQS